MPATLGRPRTPSSASPPTQDIFVPPMPDNLSKQSSKEQPRKSSLGFLRRSKSGDLKGGKKQQAALREQERLRQLQREPAVPQAPPTLPKLYNGAAPPKLQTFGGDDRPDSLAIMSGHHGSQYQTRPSAEPSRPSAVAVPVPPMPPNGAVDPYARTESMTHRGRHSYASSAISIGTASGPRRVRRRKDPTPFNILIIGAQNSGKTSFLDFLKTSLALPAKKRTTRADHQEDVFAPRITSTSGFIPHYIETEIEGERIGLTLWDSEGLEKNVVDLQLRDMSAFLESKFEETFTEEMKVIRSPGAQDTHIHCAFLLLDPARLDKNIATMKARTTNGHVMGGKYVSAATAKIVGGLDEDLDLSVFRTLQGKTTVVPVISKADSITTAHMSYLKRTVFDSLKKANLDPMEALGLDDIDGDGRDSRIDEEDEDESSTESFEADNSPGVAIPMPSPVTSTSLHSKHASLSSSRGQKQSMDGTPGGAVSTEIPYLPLSIISPDIYEPDVIGRKFPWGFADPYDAEHCDFQRLKDAVFSEWRGELREASRELWYEGWRTSRLKPRDVKRR